MSPAVFQAWLIADELKAALTEFDCDASSLAVGRDMQANGDRIRPGSLEQAETDLARSKARLKDAISAMRRILDELERQ